MLFITSCTSVQTQPIHRYHFVERSYGKTTRSIRLPETADVSKANADYSGGVLSVTFPKREVATTRRIAIPVKDGGDKVSTTEGGDAAATTSTKERGDV